MYRLKIKTYHSQNPLVQYWGNCTLWYLAQIKVTISDLMAEFLAMGILSRSRCLTLKRCNSCVNDKTMSESTIKSVFPP